MAAPAAGDGAVEWATVAGKSVRVTLVDGSAFVGMGFAASPDLPLWAFRSAAAHTFARADYRLIPVAAIRGVEVLGAGEELPALQTISEAEAAANVKRAEEAALRRAASRNPDASAVGQALFDSLNRQ
jgi:hypothetical protein